MPWEPASDDLTGRPTVMDKIAVIVPFRAGIQVIAIMSYTPQRWVHVTWMLDNKPLSVLYESPTEMLRCGRGSPP